MTVTGAEEECARLRGYADPLQLPYAWGGPVGTGEMRCSPADFVVTEQLVFAPSGAGEHLLVRIRKTGQNTRWVAKQLAGIIGIPYRAVSFAGLKDRHAITEQWFGLHLAGRPDPDFSGRLPDGVELVETIRHERKLRQGQVRSNRFRITLRRCSAIEPVAFDERLRDIARYGVPNFFGPQRFGRDAANLLLLGAAANSGRLAREARAFGISALRSGLFNGYLAVRVREGNWREPQRDDVTLSGLPRGAGETGESNPAAQLWPAGLLWGTGATTNDAEREYFGAFPRATALLEAAGARASRRVFVASVSALEAAIDGDTVTIGFELGPGAYATMVLRELLSLRDHTATAE
jgi:tRNA pseudouridine13 synthase